MFLFSFEKENLEELRRCAVRLLRAALKGDWVAAKAVLDENPDFYRAHITEEEATALHIAAAAGHTNFVKELSEGMERSDFVDLKTNYGYTALHSAAQSGNVRIAKHLFTINDALPLIDDYSGDKPLNVAAYAGNTAMVSYLLSLTPLESLTADKRIELLECTSYNDMYGKHYMLL